ncbi:MAG: hypothetical protein ACLFSA_03655 [Spirochaetaceae bacterium]
MECYGFDIHSPYLFASAGGFFLGAAISFFVLTMISIGKKRSRRAAGIYLSLSAFFTVILLSLFFIDIPSLEYTHSLALSGGVSALCGAAASAWKKIAGGTLLVLLLAFITLFSFYARQRECVEDGEPLIYLRVLSVEESRIEVEVVNYGDEAKENLSIKSFENGLEVSVGYRRTVFPQWFFFSKNRCLYRIEDIGGPGRVKPSSAGTGPESGDKEPESGITEPERRMSILESIVESLPFVHVSREVVRITEPEEFTKYSIVAEQGELAVRTSSDH